MSEPIVSIAIPARDQRERLVRTLESIGRSEFDRSRLEVVVVDDGSTDGSAAAAEELGRALPYRLIVERGCWGSQSAATNAALRRCTAPFLLMSAQDIVFHERMITEHLAAHERFSGEEIVVIGALPYPEDLEVSPFMLYLVRGGFQFAYHLIQDPLRVPPNFVYAPNLSVRRSTLDRVGAFDENLPYGCQDTDLGLRMWDAGVRLIHEAAAIGYHNHPMALEGYLPRQRTVGRAMHRLQAKHPRHLSEQPQWELVARALVACAPAREDLDRRTIERLEPIAAAEPRLAELWERAFCGGEELDRFEPGQRSTLRAAERLFSAYGRILERAMAEGFLSEAREVVGDEEVAARLRARLSALQASWSTRRSAQRQLTELGLDSPLESTGDRQHARIIAGIESYDQALDELSVHLFPTIRAFHQQIILAVEPGRLSEDQIERLSASADVVVAPGSEGVARALELATPDRIAITRPGIEVEDGAGIALAVAVFERFPEVALLGGGAVRSDGSIEYGLGQEAKRGPFFKLTRPASSAAGATPIDAVADHYAIVRKSAGLRAAALMAPGKAWNVALSLAVRECGSLVLHLPALKARGVAKACGNPLDTPSGVPILAAGPDRT